jgi:hypothetical protein
MTSFMYNLAAQYALSFVVQTNIKVCVKDLTSLTPHVVRKKYFHVIKADINKA